MFDCGMTKVKLVEYSPHPKSAGRKRSVREGLAYEKRVQAELLEAFPHADHYPSQWLSFEEEGKLRHAQPDHYVLINHRLVIFEVKLRHTPGSCAQLLKYRDLLSQLYPDQDIYLVEVYKYQDWVNYPAPTMRLSSLGDFRNLDTESIGLLNLYI